MILCHLGDIPLLARLVGELRLGVMSDDLMW